MNDFSASNPPPLPENLRQQLSAAFGANFSTGESVLQQHGRDASGRAPQCPQAVVFANSTDDVSTLLRLCHEARVAVIPYGIGSSLEGQVLASQGGISLDLSGMKRIVAVHGEDGTATVEAGVTRSELNNELKNSGLFFAVDTGADATLGGMAATRAAGTSSARYGAMRENVLSCTAVLADGTVIHTGSRARLAASGYDLTRLLIGSEGTLAVITELTVRLVPRPEACAAAVCAFAEVDDAVHCMAEALQLGLLPAKAELLDAATMKAVNALNRSCYPDVPCLFLEFHGSTAGLAEQIDLFREVAENHHLQQFNHATHEEDRRELWRAQQEAWFACTQTRPGCRALSLDIGVPITALPACLRATHDEVEKSDLAAFSFGHVAEGNLHTIVLLKPDCPADDAEFARLATFSAQLAVAHGGSISGVYGIGLGKRHLMAEEHGAGLAVMQAIKTAWDPHHILNPGKLLP